MYGKRSFRLGPAGLLPSGIKNIIIANVIVYIMIYFNQGMAQFLIENFALSAGDVIYRFKIWQLATYMFLHDPFSIMHILFNMIYLWMFGVELEREWGTREFVKFYFITGIGAGILNILLSGAPTIGASGAIYGIMLAYALRFPDRKIYIYFLFPVKMKYFIGFLILIQFFSTFGAYSDGVAHAAHLGGALVGFVYLKYWHLFYRVRSGFSDIVKGTKKVSSDMHYTSGGAKGDKTEYYRKVIDDLLDKINRVGYLNLTDAEKKLLEEGSKFLRENENNNIN